MSKLSCYVSDGSFKLKDVTAAVSVILASEDSILGLEHISRIITNDEIYEAGLFLRVTSQPLFYPAE